MNNRIIIAIILVFKSIYGYSQDLLQELPYISPKIISHQYGSYDRNGLNKDGSMGTNCTDSILHGKVNNPSGTSDGTYEYVLFSSKVPIVIKRFWLTDFPLGTLLRFYFDGEKEPSISLDISEYFTTDSIFALDFFNSSGANISYKPLLVKESLIITSNKNDGYYNIGYEQIPIDSVIDIEQYTQELGSLLRKTGTFPKNNVSNLISTDTILSIASGSAAVPFEVQGAGSIERITFYSPEMNYAIPKVITDDVNTHRGISTFTMKISRDATSFKLMRRTKTTMSTPTQNAQVFIDGVLAGNWNYNVPERSYAVWENTFFNIPASLCRNKSQIEVSIKCTSGNNAYAEAYYWMICNGTTIDSLDIGDSVDEILHQYTVTQLKSNYSYSSTYKPTAEDSLINSKLLSNVYISLYFDDVSIPYVHCPLGMFFAMGMRNLSDYTSLLFGLKEGNTMYNYLTAPYWKNAKLSIQNNSGIPITCKLHTSYQNSYIYDEDKSGYLSNYYNAAIYSSADSFVALLSAEGSGKYIGTILEAGQYDDGEFIDDEQVNWLEGDELIAIDDASTPFVYGTGTEDFFNGGFYFAFNLMSHPLYGMIYEDAQYFRTCYRYFISDPIYFKKNIHVVIEHGNWNNKKSFYKINSWYYHKKNPSIILSDSILPADDISKEAHQYTDKGFNKIIQSKFEGQYDHIEKIYHVRTSQDSIEFIVSIKAANAGVRLLRAFDNSLEYQCVKVFVNGQEVGIWSNSGKNLSQRWREDMFEIPEKFTRGKDILHIKLIPNIETPLWTATSYKAYYYPSALILNSTQATPYENVLIFPNPATTILHIKNIPTTEITYLITDMAGRTQQIISGTYTDKIDISKLSSGIYILQLYSNGIQKATHKFIKL
jgi:hypothetical protein